MSQHSFIDFILRDKRNRTLLISATIAVILQFLTFKFLYPFADFFSDSYSYIYGAAAHLDINIWPIGYSKFLQAFHELTHSDTALVGFQYFFLELSCLYFFFTILYFYNPGKTTQNIIFIFLFFNPLFLYISNYINSDPLFGALSVCWMSELLWIINRPKLYLVFTQAILLFFCFTVRNNAYYYPVISILVSAISKQSIVNKMAGIMLSLSFVSLFIIHTRNAAEKLTGTKQFSLFTGWQLANNALYMYEHLHVDSTQLPSATSRELDQLSRKFYSSVPADFDSYLYDYGANYFIRDPQAPLKQYFTKHYRPKNDYDEVSAWGKASVTFGQFGEWLIKKYPVAYSRYFMLINVKNYFLPPLEKLEVYNLGQEEVDNSAEDWFDYKTPNVTSVSKTIQGQILFLYPYLFLFVNLLFVGSLVWLILKRKSISISQDFGGTLLLSGFFMLSNFCFCVFSTIIVMRYQFFPMIVTMTFTLLLIELLDKKVQPSKIVQIPEDKNTPNLKLAKV